MPLVKVKCAWCGKEILKPKSSVEKYTNLFCSRECLNKWKAANYKGEGNPNFRGVKVRCEWCGKEYIVRPSKVGKTRFCSKECRAKWQSYRMSKEKHPLWKGGKIAKVCPVCGKIFFTHPSQNKKYCSKECAAKDRKSMIVKICPICGRIFTVPKTKMHSRVYCSKKCKAIAMKRRLKKKCLNCGKEFEVIAHEYDKRVFCSYKCMGEWMSKNNRGENNPNWKGGRSEYRGENWKIQRKKALERDNYTCQLCGSKQNLEVHHIIPFNDFKSYEKANELNNLVTLCKSCHGKIEHRFAPLFPVVVKSH